MKTVFTTGEAAKVCKVSQQTIIRCFDNGQLKGFRVPGSKFRRIPREALYKFMKDNGIPTDALESGKRKDNPAEEMRIRNVVRQVPHDLLEMTEIEKLYKNYPASGVAGKRNKAMLLPGNSHAAHGGRRCVADLFDHGTDDGIHGRRPVGRMLLHVADRQSCDELVGGPGFRNDGARLQVEYHCLGTLGAGINTDVECHGERKSSNRRTVDGRRARRAQRSASLGEFEVHGCP